MINRYMLLIAIAIAGFALGGWLVSLAGELLLKWHRRCQADKAERKPQ